MPTTVREAKLDDAAALAGLRLAALAEHSESSEPGTGFTQEFSRWFSDHRSTHLAFIAEVGGRLAGTAWLMIAERVPSPERRSRLCGDVQAVYVLPELRDGGIGAALLQALMAEARLLRLEHVTVHANDRAAPLYRRAGFRQDQLWLRWEPDQV